MRKIRKLSPAGAFIFILFAALSAQQMPEYFSGKVIAEGKKPEWLPDGSGISYTNEGLFYIYDLKADRSIQLFKLEIAEYAWINADSMLVIEWPPNATDKIQSAKIVNYWIVDRAGKKNLFAADTVVTDKVPGFNSPFRLKDGVIAIRKNPRWQKSGFPQTEKMVAFAGKGYDAEKGAKGFAYLTSSTLEGGAILFKGLDQKTYKTLIVRNRQYNFELSPDHLRILANAEGTLLALDSNGSVIADLSQSLQLAEGEKFRKFVGHAWNNASNGFAFYELYEQPSDRFRLYYYDLQTGQKRLITWINYYAQKNLKFSPDNKHLVARAVINDNDYIILMKVPETTGKK